MRKLLLFTFMLLLALSMVSAASVSRNIPARISPGEDVTVIIIVSGAESGKTFTLEDTVPVGWTLRSWDISGSADAKDKISYRFVDGTRHGWSFTASSASPQITYILAVPANAEQKSYSFSATYFDPSGFNKQESSATVRVIRCGDGVCESAENSDNCESDCPKPALPVPVPVPVPAPEPQPEEQEKGGINPLGIIVLLLVVIAGIGAYFFILRKRK